MNLVKNIFFKDDKVTTFITTRLHDNEVAEKVFLKTSGVKLDITSRHSMICLDPFCLAAWVTTQEAENLDAQSAYVSFKTDDSTNARLQVSLIEKIETEKGLLLLYRIENVNNYQLSALHRLFFWGRLIRSKTNTFYSRKVISALYSYPRRIIIVSYCDNDYCNIFPMDIQGYLEEEGLYLLGLRTTNLTLNKILEAKKVVVCDTNSVDLETVYSLGKHSSKAPTPISELPFAVSKSELFGFPVPDFSGGYKEIEIIRHKKMGYHMLLVGRVVNSKQINPNPASLFHVGFLQYKKGDYVPIDGVF